MGGQVYAGGGADTIIREYTRGVQPGTASQKAQQSRLGRGAQGWGSLTDAQREAWTQAATKVKSRSVRRMKPKAITGPQLYTSLASKFLACSPGGTVPVYPPATAFKGDPSMVLTLTASTGNLVLSANHGNLAGVKTEIKVQKLAAIYRKPEKGGFRTKSYVAFAGTSLSASIPVAPGAYSVAVQYVNVATGETSGFQIVGQVAVALALTEGGLGDESLDAAA